MRTINLDKMENKEILKENTENVLGEIDWNIVSDFIMIIVGITNLLLLIGFPFINYYSWIDFIIINIIVIIIPLPVCIVYSMKKSKEIAEKEDLK